MNGKIKKAMVLAAGYGTRLKPLTDRVPKPLVPVAGKPMIQYALDQLRAYGIEEVVINVSHLKEQLTAWLAGCKSVTFTLSEEAEPLETGGGLKKALPLLGDEPVFVINSDIIWTDEPHQTSPSPPPSGGDNPSPAGAGEGARRADEGCRGYDKLCGRGEVANFQNSTDSETALKRLARCWEDAKMDFLLLAQPRSKAVGYDKGEDHLFVKPENTIEWNSTEAPYIIAGVGIFHPRVLRGAPDGKFSVKVLWHQALAQDRLFCLPHRGRWFQTGTLADVKKAEAYLK